MPNSSFRHILELVLICLSLFVAGCSVGGGVTYKPPFGLVSLRVGTDGISVQASSPNLETPIGTFAVDLVTSLSEANNQKPPDNGLLLTIRYNKQSTLVDGVYQINTGDSRVVVTADGNITFSIENRRVFIDASKGNIQVINVSDPSTHAGDTPVANAPTPTSEPSADTPQPTSAPADTPTSTSEPAADSPTPTSVADASTSTANLPHMNPDLSLRSINSSRPVRIIFQNTTQQPLYVYWVNYYGQNIFYYALSPRQSRMQQTYVSHPWRIADQHGYLVKEVVAQYDSQIITI